MEIDEALGPEISLETIALNAKLKPILASREKFDVCLYLKLQIKRQNIYLQGPLSGPKITGLHKSGFLSESESNCCISAKLAYCTYIYFSKLHFDSLLQHF